jgi:hypothetical protein
MGASLTPLYSTYENGKSCLIIEITTNSLYILGSKLELLTDKDHDLPAKSICPTSQLFVPGQV